MQYNLAMKRTITAQTFTPTYDIVEDRIRLAINYEDYDNRIDLMITRRFALQLIPTLEECSQTRTPSSSNADENDETKKEILQQTDSTNLELLQTEAVLLEEVNIKKDEANNTILTMQCKTATVVASLDTKMMQEFCKVLKASVPKVEWGVGYNF